MSAGLQRAGISTFAELLAHELLPLGVLSESALPNEVHTLLHPRLSDHAARAFFLGQRTPLPPTAGAAAAAAGARNSLLRAWIERQGGLTPDLRRTLVEVLCPDVPHQCLTVLARWRYDDPDSEELAKFLRARDGIDPRQIQSLAALFGDGPTGAMTPPRARRATELFGMHYYHAIPFDRAALDATWRRCRAPDCWPAKREASALLGEPVENGDEPEPPPEAAQPPEPRDD
jgi:hypothetical protein